MLVACGSSEPVSKYVAGGKGNEVDADFHNLKTPPLAAGQFELMTLSTLPDTVTGGDVRMAIRGLAPGESYMVTRNGADVSGAFERVSDSEAQGGVTGLRNGENTVRPPVQGDRTHVVEGKGVDVSVRSGGGRAIQKKK